MITRVRNLQQANELASNFEWDPDTTTGLSWFHYGGSVVDLSKELVEIAPGGLLLNPNQTVQIYVDMAEAVPVLKREAIISSGNYVLLYEVTTSTDSIINVEDRRSWTAASIGNDLLGVGGGGGSNVTTFDLSIAALNPRLDYRFNHTERDGDLINYGSATGMDLSVWVDASSDPLWLNQIGGDVNGSVGIMPSGWNIENQGWATNSFDWSQFENDTEGTFIFCFAVEYDQGPVYWQFNNTASLNLDGKIGMEHFNDFIEFEYLDNSGAGSFQNRSNVAINQGTPIPDFQMIVLTQPADGGGTLLYRNGVDVSNPQGVGPGEEDLWFSDITAPDVFAVGGNYVSSTVLQSSDPVIFDRLVYVPTSLTPSEILDLYNDYATP